MARPPIPIKASEVEKLAIIGCTTDEIAAFFECSRDTIERRFAAKLKKGRADRRIKLRRAQHNAAIGGNIAMMIFLGKNELGQSDKIETKNENTNLNASLSELAVFVHPSGGECK